MFFVAALGEELGWSGYAIDALQKKRSACQAAILLGVIGAAWHLVPLAQASEPIANVDRLVVRRIDRRAGPNGPDLQWYWLECIRRSFISLDA
jgi:membrane protease YdiL (CAAX protease family)